MPVTTIDAARTPHDRLDEFVRAALRDLPDRASQRPDLLAAFDAMAASRQLDIEARRLREQGHGFYTIGSSGHESNALVAEALRPSDPALLHYRAGGFFLARTLQAGRSLSDGIRAVLLGMFAAVDDRASGGRHKVFGDASLAVIPQTSTIASHLPRAVGVAFAIGRAKRLDLPTRWEPDSIVVCSFGDASLNHSTAVGALNTVGYCVHEGLPMPLVLVCEDNGLGISVPSPTGWVVQAARRPGLHYLYADGSDPDEVRAAANEAAEVARRRRRPALLHLRTVRFLGHAGTDVESGYRSADAIGAELAHDPLLAVAERVGSRELAGRYDGIGDRVREIAESLLDAPTLRTAEQVQVPLAPRDAAEIKRAATSTAPTATGGEVNAVRAGSTLAQAINASLAQALDAHPDVLVFGEDVGRKGGVYGLTRGLQRRFGAARVFDTLLDEQSILGLGLGLGVSGLVPVPEIQYLAYLHNAEDQLRGEAASLRFFSNGAYCNPMVVRIAGLAYQKGFGGHFHNDDAVAVLRDIPGLVVAVPARPEDAGPMLRTCLAAARVGGQVSVFLEPIALYHERDLYEPGDAGWLAADTAEQHVAIGAARVHGDGEDLTIATFGNGLRMSLRVARRLAADGVRARVLDLRWLCPLPVKDLLREATATGRLLVADETRHAGGVGEGVLATLVEHGYRGRLARVSSRDSFVPLGDAANLVLLGETDIESAAYDLLS
jgi:2-oxoisovalerate dehydrogenase E1 component